MSQSEVDDIRSLIIKKRQEKIVFLTKKKENVIQELETEKEYLEAYLKTIPTVMVFPLKKRSGF